jgi:cytochrome bd-type quinol oxidase subunit 1
MLTVKSPDLRQDARSKRLKIAASALLAIPILVLLTFTFGETLGGDVSGLQHLLQAAPLVVLLVASWRFPWQGGIALLVIGISVLSFWLFFALEGEMSVAGLAVTVVLLFAPPLVAGWLFLKAGHPAARM